MTRCLLLGPGGRAQGRCRGKLHCCCFLALSSSLVARASAAPGDPAPLSDSLTRGFPGGGSSHGLRLALPAGAALTPRVGALGAAPASCRASVPTTRPVLGRESRGGVRGGCIPCADEPALEPGLRKPLSGRWVSWNSCRLRTRGQRPPRSDVPFSLGAVTLLKGWRSLWGGLGGRRTVSSQGPSSWGPPHSRGCAM